MIGTIERTMTLAEAWYHLWNFGGADGGPIADRQLARIRSEAGISGKHESAEIPFPTEEQLRTAIKLGIEVISKRRSPPHALIRHMYEALGEDAPAPRRPTPHEMLEAHRAEVKRRQERAAAKALRMARRNARA